MDRLSKEIKWGDKERLSGKLTSSTIEKLNEGIN